MFTNAQVAALVNDLRNEVATLKAAQAPTTAAPAQAKAESPFVIDMRARAAAKLPCAIHSTALCNRRFSVKSSGGTNHIAAIRASK